jgi:hypothetical protein
MRIVKFVPAITVVALAAMPVFAAEQVEIRRAVEKSLPPLFKAGPSFVKVSGCASCHNNTLPMMAASMAKKHGLAMDEQGFDQNIQQQNGFMMAMATQFREPMLEASYGVPDVQVALPYVLLALKAQNVPASGVTAAAVHAIASRQLPGGSWPSYINRAPIENGDIQATALAVRAIQLYGMPGRQEEWKRRIASAREWLGDAVAKTTEDKIMLVSGLAWAGADAEAVANAARTLLAEQREDGGWAQLTTLDSDAYATGHALVALEQAGVLTTTDAAYRRGVRYLLTTQQADGTWVTKTRAFPFQPLKESGFPHGRDQWISAAATSWAAMALANAIEPATVAYSSGVSDQNDVVGAKAAGVDQIAAFRPVE